MFETNAGNGRMPPKNSVKNTAGPVRDSATGRLSGGNPGNRGGRRGRSGRPPNEFRDLCQRIAAKPEVVAALERAASDPESKGYAAATKIIFAYGYGRPEELHKHTGKVERILRVIRDPLILAPRPKESDGA